MSDCDAPPPPERAAELKRAVRRKYADVAADAAGRFPYPVGRAGALALGYAAEEIDAVDAEVVARFVGVGRPFAARAPRAGESVLDLGCGAGLDALLAARAVGATGRAVGVDLAPEMLAVARRGGGAAPRAAFVVADVEALPFPDASFDLATSNGALNLVPDKDAAFREVFRVLRPGGAFVFADLLVKETVPADVLASQDAWSH